MKTSNYYELNKLTITSTLHSSIPTYNFNIAVYLYDDAGRLFGIESINLVTSSKNEFPI